MGATKMSIEAITEKGELKIRNLANGKTYCCNNETDMSILCSDVNQEADYVIRRHDRMVECLVNINDLLKEANLKLMEEKL